MKNLKLKITFLLFAILYLIFNIRNTYAQSISISIDPPIIQIDADAPALIKTPITIQNESDQNITYGIFLVPFKAGSLQNGQPEFDNTLIESYREFFKRIKISDKDQSLTEISLAPQQKKDLTLSISISKAEESKDFYFSVIFISQGLDDVKSNSTLSARGGIGTNVLLSVGPKSEARGRILEFLAPSFATRGPVNFKLKIANQSSHFVNAKGNLIIKNIFGQVVGNIDLVPVNILADSSRFMESENNQDPNNPSIVWDEKFLLGIYKAEVEVALSDQGPLLKDKRVIYAFPIQVILLLGLSLILLFGIVKRARTKS